MDKIDQIVENLDKRSESNEYIVEYLIDIIKGIRKTSPKQVDSYLDIVIHNQQH